MDKLRAMEAFTIMAEAGSLTAAASRMGLSNAAVTAQLQALEAHLRATLLHRTTRHLRLTEEGTLFLRQARSILSAMAEAEAEVSLNLVRGVLRVQVPIAVGHLILARALPAFAARHPELRVVAVLDNDVDGLAGSPIDVAVRIDEVETADLVARPIYRSTHVICAAPAFLARHGAPLHPADIDPARCLGWVANASARARPWRLRRGSDTATVHPTGGLFFNSTDALLRAATEDGGFIYVLDLLAHAALGAGQLVPVLPGWDTEEQVFYVTYPKTRFLPPKVRAFAEFLAHAFPQHLRPEAQSTVRVRGRRQPAVPTSKAGSPP